MKSISRHAVGVLALAFVLLEAVPAGGDPETARNEGCLGETFRVAIDSHVHTNNKINAESGMSLTGTKVIRDYDLTLRGTYVRELHDGKTRWAKRSIEWSGQSSSVVFGCYSDASEAGGQVELDPTDGPVETMSEKDRDKMKMMKWNVKPEKNLGGSCFLFPGGGGGGASLRFPEIRAMGDKLRMGHYYMAVDRDGSRYSEEVELRGNEQVSISAEHTEIVPNQSLKNTDEATSQLTVRATCDGAPLKDRQIGLRIDVKPRSGHHNHLPNRPRGKFAVGDTETDCGFETGAPPVDDTSCIPVKTDANGEAKVKFKSPLTGSVDPTEKGAGPYRSGIAGDYKITAKDAQFTQVRDSTEILAKVKDLKPATFDSNLEELRGGTSAHPDGSYGTERTLNAFTKLAKAFHDSQILHNILLTGEYGKKAEWLPVVSASTNDIALPEGGIFDWNTTKTPWRPSHQTHNKGGGGDFNRFGDYSNKTRTECGGTTANLQVWYMQVFIELGKDSGQWDCSDLGASGGYPMFSPQACAVGEIPTGEVIAPFVGPEGPAVFYVPPRLHLHVED